jgi:hypothetical protein
LCRGGQALVLGCCATDKEKEGIIEEKYVNKRISNETEEQHTKILVLSRNRRIDNI